MKIIILVRPEKTNISRAREMYMLNKDEIYGSAKDPASKNMNLNINKKYLQNFDLQKVRMVDKGMSYG